MATDLDVKQVAQVAAQQPATPASKAEVWRAQGKCPTCGKPVLRPKDGGLGSTCAEHAGKLRQGAASANAIPTGYIKMSDMCRKLEKAGFTTSFIVRACGGDATVGQPVHEMFRPVYVGSRKFMDPRTVTEEGIKILKAAQKPAATPDVKPQGTPSTPAQVNAVAASLKQAAKK